MLKMENSGREDLLHREAPGEPRLIYHHSPLKALVIQFILLAVIGTLLFLAARHAWQAVPVFSLLALAVVFRLLKNYSVRIWIDWPNIVYRYRSLFRGVHLTLQPWEISDISPEVTSMWRGNISERLVMNVGKKKHLICPFYSENDENIRKALDAIASLPGTRKQAEYELELERRVAAGEGDEQEDSEKEMVWCMMEMSVDCPRCDTPVVVNGPFTLLKCPECDEAIELTEENWADLLEDIRDEIAYDTEDGKGNRSEIWGVYNTSLYYGRLQPHCPECGEDLDIGDHSGESSATCRKCGTVVPVQQAPSWFDDVFQGAELIVAASSDPSEQALEGSDEAITFKCPGCGAALTTKGEERNFSCPYCEGPVFLPDDIWLHFHPAPMKKRWFVGFKAEKTADYE